MLPKVETFSRFNDEYGKQIVSQSKTATMLWHHTLLSSEVTSRLFGERTLVSTDTLVICFANVCISCASARMSSEYFLDDYCGSNFWVSLGNLCF